MFAGKAPEGGGGGGDGEGGVGAVSSLSPPNIAITDVHSVNLKWSFCKGDMMTRNMGK